MNSYTAKDIMDLLTKLDELHEKGNGWSYPKLANEEERAFRNLLAVSWPTLSAALRASQHGPDDASPFWWRDAMRERPHPKLLVIAWTKEYGALLADRTTSNPQFGWSCDGTVTHWMPIPDAPSATLQQGEKA